MTRKNRVVEGRRVAILEAELAIAGGDGASAVTHRAVSEKAGVAPGLITYCFASTRV
jgi:DNA-binding transcriptional regulator YbjK